MRSSPAGNCAQTYAACRFVRKAPVDGLGWAAQRLETPDLSSISPLRSPRCCRPVVSVAPTAGPAMRRLTLRRWREN